MANSRKIRSEAYLHQKLLTVQAMIKVLLLSTQFYDNSVTVSVCFIYY